MTYCKYCASKLYSKDDFCSKDCEDKYPKVWEGMGYSHLS